MGKQPVTELDRLKQESEGLRMALKLYQDPIATDPCPICKMPVHHSRNTDNAINKVTAPPAIQALIGIVLHQQNNATATYTHVHTACLYLHAYTGSLEQITTERREKDAALASVATARAEGRVEALSQTQTANQGTLDSERKRWAKERAMLQQRIDDLLAEATA